MWIQEREKNTRNSPTHTERDTRDEMSEWIGSCYACMCACICLHVCYSIHWNERSSDKRNVKFFILTGNSFTRLRFFSVQWTLRYKQHAVTHAVSYHDQYMFDSCNSRIPCNCNFILFIYMKREIWAFCLPLLHKDIKVWKKVKWNEQPFVWL